MYNLKSTCGRCSVAFALTRLTRVPVGLFGRILPNYISDSFIGPLNTLILLAAVSALLLLTWIAVHNRGGLIAFAVVYG